MIISDTVLTISSHIPFLLYSWIWAWVDKTVITLTALNDLIFDELTVSKAYPQLYLIGCLRKELFLVLK